MEPTAKAVTRGDDGLSDIGGPPSASRGTAGGGSAPLHISILTPTHNRAQLLLQMLRSVSDLRVPPDLAIDVIVVASACTDDTADVVRRFAPSMPFPCKCIDEPLPGAGRARNRAMREARGDVIACLDDDVLVDPGWLEALVRTFAEYPADLVSGKVDLWWGEIERPQWAGPVVEALLSVNDFGNAVIPLNGKVGGNTANLAFRHKVLDTIGEMRTDLGRSGEQKLSGEDGEWTERAVAAGFRMIYSPYPRVRHWVPASRVNLDYLGSVAFGNGVSYILMKKRLGTYVLARAVAGYSYLVVRHGAASAVARLTGNRRAQVSGWLLARLGMGGWSGLWRRFAKGQ